jgi:hypothetical protein
MRLMMACASLKPRGGKLLHALIDFCGQSAKFIHGHGVLPD